MSTIVNKVGSIIGGTVQIQFQLMSKDVTDATLVTKFGDILITTTGTFNDPNDATFPPFYVSAGGPIAFFTAGVMTAQFADPTLTMATLERRANLWGTSIGSQLSTKILALRALTDTVTGTTVITI